MELKVKLWLSDDKGAGVLGEGRYQLLREIGRCHKLQQAAEALGISYRKAWGDIRAMETRLGYKILIRQRGGKGGGGSILTERGEKLVESYGQIKTDIEGEVRKQYNRRLKRIVQPQRES